MFMRVLLFLGVMIALSACQREATDPTAPAPLATSAPASAPNSGVAPPKDINGLARPADQAGLTPMDKQANLAPEDKMRGEVGSPEEANKMVRGEKQKAMRAARSSSPPAAPSVAAPIPNREQPPPAAPPEEAKPVVSLQKMPCFGDCERFTISLFADGRMYLDAQKGLDRVGEYERNLFTTETRELLRELAQLEQLELKDVYSEEEQIVDIPATVVSLRDAEGNVRRITVYADAPKELGQLITKLEEMARGAFWRKSMR